MNLEPQDLEKLARLARLTITEKDQQEVLPALNSVLNWVGDLAKAPTAGIDPMAHPHDLALRLREDRPESLPPAAAAGKWQWRARRSRQSRSQPEWQPCATGLPAG